MPSPRVVREDVAKRQEVRLMGFVTWNLRSVAARTRQIDSRRYPDYHPGTQTRGLFGWRSAFAGGSAQYREGESQNTQHPQRSHDPSVSQPVTPLPTPL